MCALEGKFFHYHSDGLGLVLGLRPNHLNTTCTHFIWSIFESHPSRTVFSQEGQSRMVKVFG
jgi:hypothetical protein